MIFTNYFFLSGIALCIGGLIYLSSFPPPIKTEDELQAEEEQRQRNLPLSKEERKKMMTEVLKEQLKKYNPQMTEDDFKSATSAAKDRQKAFLRKLDPQTRDHFLTTMRSMKKRMTRIEKMSPEEIEEEARSIEANKFRMICIKFIILLVIIWMVGSMWFDVNTPLEVKDKITEEFHNFFQGVKNVAVKRAVNAPTGLNSFADPSTDL